MATLLILKKDYREEGKPFFFADNSIFTVNKGIPFFSTTTRAYFRLRSFPQNIHQIFASNEKGEMEEIKLRERIDDRMSAAMERNIFGQKEGVYVFIILLLVRVRVFGLPNINRKRGRSTLSITRGVEFADLTNPPPLPCKPWQTFVRLIQIKITLKSRIFMYFNYYFLAVYMSKSHLKKHDLSLNCRK